MNISRTLFSEQLEQHQMVFGLLPGLYLDFHRLIQECLRTFKLGGKLVFFGNGGSAADSQHLAAEFMVRYKHDRRPLPAISLTTDTSIITAHSNDYTYESVFARQVEALVKPQDVVIGITTSGNSPNVKLGLEAANEVGAFTAVLSGRDGGQSAKVAQLSLIVPSDETARIQEAHIFLGHTLCEVIDQIILCEN